MRIRTISCLALVFLLALTVFTQAHFLSYRYKPAEPVPGCSWCDGKEGEDILYVPISASAMRLLAPADSNFLADILWMRTAYYFGQHALTDREYPYLLHLVDLVTDLSPAWIEPYTFGAVVLPTEGQAVADGMYLIEKGLVNHPRNWQLWFFKGYFLWQYEQDLVGASEAIYAASEIPGAPFYLRRLSATLATRGGQKELAAHFLEQSLRNVRDATQRRLLIEKFKEVTGGR